MASRKRRILVTGVARWWGALVVQRLVEDPDVAEVIGIDTREPRYDLGRADYLKLDVRHSLIGKLVRAVGIDTVVHTLTRVDSFDMDPRRAHEMNVIGTLNLLAGCAGEGSPVRRFVLKSSGHVYGSRFDLPAGRGCARPTASTATRATSSCATSSRSSHMSPTSGCAIQRSTSWRCDSQTASTPMSPSRWRGTSTSRWCRRSRVTTPRFSSSTATTAWRRWSLRPSAARPALTTSELRVWSPCPGSSIRWASCTLPCFPR